MSEPRPINRVSEEMIADADEIQRLIALRLFVARGRVGPFPKKELPDDQ